MDGYEAQDREDRDRLDSAVRQRMVRSSGYVISNERIRELLGLRPLVEIEPTDTVVFSDIAFLSDEVWDPGRRGGSIKYDRSEPEYDPGC